MRKIKLIFAVVLTFLFSIALTSCSLFFVALDHSSVEAFGNVSFYESGMIGCIDWIVDGDELYYYVSSLDGKVEYDVALGAFNDIDHGYTLYSLKGDEYKGITVLEYKSMMDTVQLVYASENADAVPCSILFDIPHKDDWLSGGQNFTLNDVVYSNYGSTQPNAIEKGEEIGTVNNVTYYRVPGFEEWVCSVNAYDSERLDISYATSMTSLPVSMLKLVKAI